MRKGIMAVGLATALVVSGFGYNQLVMADSQKVVTIGHDLTEEQKTAIKQYFGVLNDPAVQFIEVNNQQEHQYLDAYAPQEQIGTHTISCAFVNPTISGGIQVKTANLNWVTSNMIATTLSTSGVQNCEVVAAAPYVVSGTGALTGIMLAYETAVGENLDPTKKNIANQELITTGTIGNRIGQNEATGIVNDIKIQVISGENVTPDQIDTYIGEAESEYGITLSDDERTLIQDLMNQIAQQNYDYTQMQETLQRVEENVSQPQQIINNTDNSVVTNTTDNSVVTNNIDNSVTNNNVDNSVTNNTTNNSILSGTDESALGGNVQEDSTTQPVNPVEPTNPEVPTDNTGMEGQSVTDPTMEIPSEDINNPDSLNSGSDDMSVVPIVDGQNVTSEDQNVTSEDQNVTPEDPNVNVDVQNPDTPPVENVTLDNTTQENVEGDPNNMSTDVETPTDVPTDTTQVADTEAPATPAVSLDEINSSNSYLIMDQTSNSYISVGSKNLGIILPYDNLVLRNTTISFVDSTTVDGTPTQQIVLADENGMTSSASVGPLSEDYKGALGVSEGTYVTVNMDSVLVPASSYTISIIGTAYQDTDGTLDGSEPQALVNINLNSTVNTFGADINDVPVEGLASGSTYTGTVYFTEGTTFAKFRNVDDLTTGIYDITEFTPDANTFNITTSSVGDKVIIVDFYSSSEGYASGEEPVGTSQIFLHVV